VIVPSVEHFLLQDTESGLYFGHLRINHFQESTVQEVKEALAVLQTNGIKGLVLDLRGNPGGLFDSGVQVARLFLTGGVIAYTHSQLKEYNQPQKADGMGAFLLPVVVLVDGDTASAAELLAGALKENGRAKVIGQTTYGKGTIQHVFTLDKAPLDKNPGGIRLTVARFDSPTKVSYTGRGVVPHELGEGEAALTRAVAVLLAATRAMDMGMGMNTYDPR
jgi:carboxyl-terminal processing protease